jgi:hypothetical protein
MNYRSRHAALSLPLCCLTISALLVGCGATEGADTAADQVTSATGAIAGRLSYGSDHVPEMHVVAFATDGSRFFDTWTVASLSVVPYRIEVPPGTYYVAAYTRNHDPRVTQAYSEWDACGGADGCDRSILDNNFIAPVRVGAGQVVRNINPNDYVTRRVPAEPVPGQPFGCGDFAARARCVPLDATDTERSVLMWCLDGLLRAQDCRDLPALHEMRCGFSPALDGMNCVER